MKRKQQDLGSLFSSLEITKKIRVEDITNSLKSLKFKPVQPIFLSPIAEEEESTESGITIQISAHDKFDGLPKQIFTKLNPENSQVVLYRKNRWKLPNGR